MTHVTWAMVSGVEVGVGVGVGQVDDGEVKARIKGKGSELHC